MAIAAGLVLTSCSSADASASNAPTDEIVTPAGTTIEMPDDPQAALGFYTTDVDILTTLGVPLSQSQPIRDEYTAFPEFFDQSKLEGLDAFHNYPEYNFEGVANANPDFILNGLGYGHRPDVYLQRLRRRRLARLSIEGRGGPWARGPVAGMGRGVPGTCR